MTSLKIPKIYKTKIILIDLVDLLSFSVVNCDGCCHTHEISQKFFWGSAMLRSTLSQHFPKTILDFNKRGIKPIRAYKVNSQTCIFLFF